MSGLNGKETAGEYWNVLSLYRGTLTDNGATPWYTVFMVGSERQKLKFAIDTGTTHSWVTSIQCTTDAGLNHQRFDFRSSLSYVQVTDPYNPVSISFGPWGTVTATLGSDYITFMNPAAGTPPAVRDIPDYKMYIVQNYSGQQFLDLIWDGAIGVPASRPAEIDSSELFDILMKSESFPFTHRALRVNYKEKVIQFVDLGMDDAVEDMIIAPLVENRILQNLWAVKAGPVLVEDAPIINNVLLCLDTGSSCFKGDPKIIEPIIRALTRGGNLPTYIAKENPDFSIYPELILTLQGVEIHVKPQQYFERLATNYYKLGFSDMEGLDRILIAGSDFLEHHEPTFFFGNENGNAGIGLKVET